MRCGIILIHPTNESVLMVKQRSSGKLSIPKGKIKYGKETMLQCALREMEEETGINLRQVPHIFRGKISIRFDRDHHYYLVNLRKHISDRNITPKDIREIQYGKWIDLKKIHEVRMNVVSRRILEKVIRCHITPNWFNWRNTSSKQNSLYRKSS